MHQDTMKTNTLLIFGALCLFLSLASFTKPPVGYKIGDKVADFSLKGVDGKNHSLAEFKQAKGYIIVFTCNECPYAQMYEQRIIQLHNKYSKLGYPVLAINPSLVDYFPEESYDEMVKRSKASKFTFHYLFDKNQGVTKLFRPSKTPHVFLLDKNRVVKYIGAIDDNPQSAVAVKKKYVESAIEALNKGKNPTPAETKAIGCAIKIN